MIAMLSAAAQRPIATSIFIVVVATIARILQRGFTHRKSLRDLVRTIPRLIVSQHSNH